MSVRQTPLGCFLLALTVPLAAGPATAQSSKSDLPKTGKKEPAKNERLYAVGAFAGKLLEVDSDGKSFLFRVYGQTAVPRFTPGNPASC